MDSERFDYLLIVVLKWVIAIALLPCVVMPIQIVWFFIFPIFKLLTKKAKDNATLDSWIPEGLASFWFPIEIYGKYARKFLGLDEF
ncbi:MAG: hypothetical protein LBG88_04040 [Christensenellaceae bacterium]|jgi:hypothetical protein|nr:hypothetical protein [Christensenellaceae bacterium]